MPPNRILTVVRKAIASTILVALITTSVQSPAYAQLASVDPMPRMPVPGVMVHLSPEFTPAYLKGIVIHPENALRFDFIIYKGDKVLTDAQKRIEYNKLTKYFLASLAIPDDDQWVNLSPYEKDRIIKDDFGKTEMGRDLLAQDYMLKQITASLIYPENNLGKKFWNKIYTEAQKQYGTTNIPVNTFNKVWILPDNALIYEKDDTAYILKNHLRVMLEEDYLSLQKHAGINRKIVQNDVNALGSRIVRQIVLPQLEREVNEGKNFAALRQVYSGMLLAAWYKQALKESFLGKIYTNKAKVKGIDQDPKTNEVIYQQYLKAYKKGVFNFIKEDVDRYTHETVPRKYFSGGAGDYAMAAKYFGKVVHHTSDLAVLRRYKTKPSNIDLASVALKESGAAANADKAMNIGFMKFNTRTRWTPAQIEVAQILRRVKQDHRYRPPIILFLCKGNIHRSTLQHMIASEMILRKQETGSSESLAIIHSAGTVIWGNEVREIGKMLSTTIDAQERGIEKGRLERIIKIIAGVPEHQELTPATQVTALLKFERERKVDGISDQELAVLSSIFDKVYGEVMQLGSTESSLDEVKRIAKDRGIRNAIVGKFKSQTVIPRDVREADLIFVADQSIAQFISIFFPQANAKTFKLRALSTKYSSRDFDMPDPQSDKKITVPELFGQIDKLIKDNLMPLLLNPEDVQQQPANEVTLSWNSDSGRSKISMKIIPSRKEQEGALFVSSISIQGKEVPFFISGEVTKRLLIKSGENLKFGKVGDAYVIIVPGRVFKYGTTKALQGRTAFVDIGSQEIGFVPTRTLSNTHEGLIVKTSSNTTETFIDDRVNFIVTLEAGEQHKVIFNMAMTTSKAKLVKTELTPGGIDFNAAHLNLQIKRDGKGIPLPLAQQDMAQLSNIAGLYPVILSIKPSSSLPIFSEQLHASSGA